MILLLLLHPAVEHDLGMGRIARGLFPAVADQGRDQAIAGAKELLHLILGQITGLDRFRVHRLSRRRGDRALGEGHRVAPVLFGRLALGQLDIAAVERLVECGARRLDLLHGLYLAPAAAADQNGQRPDDDKRSNPGIHDVVPPLYAMRGAAAIRRRTPRYG